MKVNILYFAQLKEVSRKDRESLEVFEGTTLNGIFQLLQSQYGHDFFEIKSLRAAVNEEFSPLDQILKEGDTVALLPPVSGG